jgi:hypothetical protein
MDLKGTAAGSYSVFQIGTSAKFKIVRVHQWSYEHFVGPIPPGCAPQGQRMKPLKS